MINQFRYLILFTSLILSNQNTFSQDTLTSVSPFNTIKESNWDIELFRTINNNRSNFKDGIFSVIDRSVLPVAIFYPAAMGLYARVKNNYYDENTALLMGVSELTSFSFTLALKHLIKRPRPYKTLSNVTTYKKSPADEWSFPSTHTSTAFSIAMMNVLRYPDCPQLYLPIYFYAFISSYARPYFGMHYPTDLLGGILTGTSSSLLIFALRKEVISFKNNIFNESNRSDTGSIRSNNLFLFGASFVFSAILTEIVFSQSRLKVSFTNHEQNFDLPKLVLTYHF